MQRKQKKGLQIWDINTKCALAMIHTGVCPVQVGNFFSTLNIPPITEKALKSREREIGGVVEEAAKTSCQEALLREIELTQLTDTGIETQVHMPCEKGDAVSSTDRELQVDRSSASNVQNEEDAVITSLCVSFDGGWQKRVSGKCYNSLTGHATLIGQQTGKCIDFGVKSSDCRKWLYTDNDADHDCRKNFCGSAKAMESAIAVELLSNLKEIGYKVSTITMDDDSTTIARLHSSVDANLQKNCDKNHIKKNLTNSLYGVKASNPCLSRSIINYFVENLPYAIAQNQDKPLAMKNALTAIVPHAFGCHENCNSLWCGFLRNPYTYKHTDLPGGLDLTDKKLEQDLRSVFQLFSDKSEKLAHSGSTQGNESLNQLISTKAPKAKHFGGSESLNYRVAAGVVQKNEGQKYVSDVNEKHGLSPGKVTLKRNDQHDKKRLRSKSLASLPSTKRKRKTKKSSSREKTSANEGDTYCSHIDLDRPIAIQDVSHIPECTLPL